jgi:transposase
VHPCNTLTLDLPSPQRVERLWNRLKEWRAVATRYEKTAASFMGVLCLAAVFGWIKKDIKP